MENTVRIRILRCGTMTPPVAAYPGVPKRYVRRGRVELPEQEKYWTPRTVYALRQPRSLAWLSDASREANCAAVLFGHDPEEAPRVIEF